MYGVFLKILAANFAPEKILIFLNDYAAESPEPVSIKVIPVKRNDILGGVPGRRSSFQEVLLLISLWRESAKDVS